MENIIFGTGSFAREADKILESQGISISAFVNNKAELPSEVYNHKPIFHIDEIDLDCGVNIIIAKKPMFLGSAIQYLKEKGYNNVFWVREEIFFEKIKTLEDLHSFLVMLDLNRKPILNYLETNITDHCNLNCKGCSHFSNICKSSFINVIDLEKDLDKINKHFTLLCFRLLGGEPLIHPDIVNIFNKTRASLPDTELIIVTNGILIPQISQKVMDAIRENNIIVSISLYEPMMERLSLIINRLEENHIKYFINDDYFKEPTIIHQFHTALSTLKNEEGYEANKKCGGRFCRFLRNGKISKCYYPLLIEILNDEYGTKFEITDDDYIELNEIIDGWIAIDAMNGDIPFCEYCRVNYQEFEWSTASKKVARLNDYVLKLKR